MMLKCTATCLLALALFGNFCDAQWLRQSPGGNQKPMPPRQEPSKQLPADPQQTRQTFEQPLTWTYPEDPKPEPSVEVPFETRHPVPVATVAVDCRESYVHVEVKKDMFGTGQFINTEGLTLGDCGVTAEDTNGQVLIFEYELQSCGSALVMTDSSMIYSYVLNYNPPMYADSPVVRTSKAAVIVECHYPRKNNVSSLALDPLWIPFSAVKVAEEFLYFSLKLMTDDWVHERPSYQYFLGDMINIEASVMQYFHVPLRVYVDYCVATLAPDVTTNPRYAFIDNHGCFIDARVTRSVSMFLPRSVENKLQFQLEAFRFQGVDSGLMYITCHLKATSTSHAAHEQHRACSYMGNTWKEAGGSDSVCGSCDNGLNIPAFAAGSGSGFVAGGGSVYGGGSTAGALGSGYTGGSVTGSGSGTGSGYVAGSTTGSGSAKVPGSGLRYGGLSTPGVVAGTGYVAGSGTGTGSGYVAGSGTGTGSGYVAGSGTGTGSGYVAGSSTSSQTSYVAGKVPASGSGSVYGGLSSPGVVAGSGSGTGSGYVAGSGSVTGSTYTQSSQTRYVSGQVPASGSGSVGGSGSAGGSGYTQSSHTRYVSGQVPASGSGSVGGSGSAGGSGYTQSSQTRYVSGQVPASGSASGSGSGYGVPYRGVSGTGSGYVTGSTTGSDTRYVSGKVPGSGSGSGSGSAAGTTWYTVYESRTQTGSDPQVVAGTGTGTGTGTVYGAGSTGLWTLPETGSVSGSGTWSTVSRIPQTPSARKSRDVSTQEVFDWEGDVTLGPFVIHEKVI